MPENVKPTLKTSALPSIGLKASRVGASAGTGSVSQIREQIPTPTPTPVLNAPQSAFPPNVAPFPVQFPHSVDSNVPLSNPVHPQNQTVRMPVQNKSRGTKNDTMNKSSLPPQLLNPKIFFAVLAVAFFLGLFFGVSMSGDSTPSPKQAGAIEGVVLNEAINGRRIRRCGTGSNQKKECVLFIMNSKPYERQARDFFIEAENITGVPRYTIQPSNMLYASRIIPSGAFAQIYIPDRN